MNRRLSRNSFGELPARVAGLLMIDSFREHRSRRRAFWLRAPQNPGGMIASASAAPSPPIGNSPARWSPRKSASSFLIPASRRTGSSSPTVSGTATKHRRHALLARGSGKEIQDASVR